MVGAVARHRNHRVAGSIRRGTRNDTVRASKKSDVVGRRGGQSLTAIQKVCNFVFKIMGFG